MPTTHALLPAVATWLLANPWSTHTTPSQVWLSHPSLEYAHHAHLSVSASCGYVAISLIPEVRTPRPARCGYVAISPIPGVRPPRPLSASAAMWLSHLSLEYAHHAQPGVAMWLSHPSLQYAHHSASANCGYVAISLIPGVRTPRPAKCGYLTHPWSTPTSLPLPAVAMWLSHLSLEYAHHAQPGVAISPIPESGAPVVYYLIDGPLRGFVREELLVVPSDTQQPPRRLIPKV